MAHFKQKMGRREIFFSDHALDRYWQRYMDDNPCAGRKDCKVQLDADLKKATWSRTAPPWTHLSIYHRARCEGVVMLDADRCFIINKNPSRDLVAVTYLENAAKMRRRKDKPNAQDRAA